MSKALDRSTAHPKALALARDATHLGHIEGLLGEAPGGLYR